MFMCFGEYDEVNTPALHKLKWQLDLDTQTIYRYMLCPPNILRQTLHQHPKQANCETKRIPPPNHTIHVDPADVAPAQRAGPHLNPSGVGALPLTELF